MSNPITPKAKIIAKVKSQPVEPMVDLILKPRIDRLRLDSDKIIEELRDKLTVCKLIKIKKDITYMVDEKTRVIEGNINNVGGDVESVLCDYLITNHTGFSRGPQQKSPDMYYESNGRRVEVEIKAYQNNPSFDIANFRSYIDQLSSDNGVSRKLYRTVYLIVKYDVRNRLVVFSTVQLNRTWQIFGYTGIYPITIQSKKEIWHSIRPHLGNYGTKTPKQWAIGLLKAIEEAPCFVNKQHVTKEGQHLLNIITVQLQTLRVLD
jgi:hypothetical protein